MCCCNPAGAGLVRAPPPRLKTSTEWPLPSAPSLPILFHICVWRRPEAPPHVVPRVLCTVDASPAPHVFSVCARVCVVSCLVLDASPGPTIAWCCTRRDAAAFMLPTKRTMMSLRAIGRATAPNVAPAPHARMSAPSRPGRRPPSRRRPWARPHKQTCKGTLSSTIFAGAGGWRCLLFGRWKDRHGELSWRSRAHQRLQGQSTSD